MNIIVQHFKDGSREYFEGFEVQRHRKTYAIVTKDGVREIPIKDSTLLKDARLVDRPRDRETH